MDYSHLFQDMDIDIDDMEILEAAIPCSPNLIPETISREQPAEASGSCPLKDLIKLEKPVRFEAANPPYNANDTKGPSGSSTGDASPEVEAQALLTHLTSTMREIQMKRVKVITTISGRESLKP